MAQIVPTSQGALPPGTSHVCASLFEFPDDWRGWWLKLLPEYKDRPDFFLLTPDNKGFFISGLHLNAKELGSLSQTYLAQGVIPESRLQAAEVMRCLKAAGENLKSNAHRKLSRIIVLTAVRRNQINIAEIQRLAPGISVMVRDDFSPARLISEAANIPGLTDEERALVHAQYTTESVVPPAFSSRTVDTTSANKTAQIGTLLLDADQDDWVKRELLLPSGAIKEESDSTATLITGVAGSGKSLVLLYRALLEARLSPDAGILLLTHNESLETDLKRKAVRLQEIQGGPEIKIRSFYRWCGEWARPYWRKAVQYDSQRRALEAALGKLDEDSLRFHQDEFGWIQDQGIHTLEEYAKVERTGRLYPLRPERRAEVFDEFLAYKEYLESVERTDWAGLVDRILEAVKRGEINVPQYHRVFIDEAQFFARTWFQIVHRAIGPRGRVFIAADPTQGFLQRKQSWGELGFNIRGRSTRLKRAYRSTRSILLFARDFYLGRGGDVNDSDLNLPEMAELTAAPVGAWPIVLRGRLAQDEPQLLIAALRDYRRARSLGRVLIIHADGTKVRDLVSFLNNQLKEAEAVEAVAATNPNQLRVCSLEKATGLEAPIVFILGIRHLLEAEANPHLAKGNLDQVREGNSKKMYMGFTRAGQQLVVIWSGQQDPVFPVESILRQGETSKHSLPVNTSGELS